MEFAIVFSLTLVLLLGIMEFGRFLYLNETVQEVTRRAARDQVVRWIDQVSAVQRSAVFRPGSSGTAYLPAVAEVTNSTVSLSFYNTYADALSMSNSLTPSGNALDNFNECLKNTPDCIRYVRASLLDGQGNPIQYVPMVGLFGAGTHNMPPGVGFVDLRINVPGSTVIMPAESLGLTP